jgi:phospholipase B1
MLWLGGEPIKVASIISLLIFPVCAQRYAEDIKQCPPLEPRYNPPTDITDLRPDDIKVVMALGDSVTAAFGAKLINIFDTKILQEYRGLSFSMGGDPNAPTIANHIRYYQPELVGSSRGTHFIELCVDGVFCAPDELAYRPQQDVFNAALSGAVSGTLGLETKYLLRQVNKHYAVNVTTDWKMLTMFIGTNEVCRYGCEDRDAGMPGTPDDFEQRIMTTLTTIHNKLPRTLVNILLLPDMSQVEQFANSHPRCMHVRRILSSICPCAMESEAGRWAMRRTVAEYNQRIIRIAKRVNLHARQTAKDSARPLEFSIIISPLLRDTDLRNDTPAHFAAKLDCFHPSATAHRSLAVSIW